MVSQVREGPHNGLFGDDRNSLACEPLNLLIIPNSLHPPIAVPTTLSTARRTVSSGQRQLICSCKTTGDTSFRWLQVHVKNMAREKSCNIRRPGLGNMRPNNPSNTPSLSTTKHHLSQQSGGALRSDLHASHEKDLDNPWYCLFSFGEAPAFVTGINTMNTSFLKQWFDALGVLVNICRW